MRETITFVLNNRIERVSGLSGDATLLDWLRQRRRLTGSRKAAPRGCAGPALWLSPGTIPSPGPCAGIR